MFNCRGFGRVLGSELLQLAGVGLFSCAGSRCWQE